jgi:hypothetical protein
MTFADIVNPTPEELRRWAADPDADYPDEMSQDWDLIVADWSRIDVIVELASDPACPMRWFFVAVLYLMAGDCVRNEAGHQNTPHLNALVHRLESATSEPLILFRQRALGLLANPSTFDYKLWCDGGYVYQRGGRAGEG